MVKLLICLDIKPSYFTVQTLDDLLNPFNKLLEYHSKSGFGINPDFRPVLYNNVTVDVRNPNVWILNVIFCPKSKLFCSDFGHNTKLDHFIHNIFILNGLA